MSRPKSTHPRQSTQRPLRVGYVPLNDAAPLIMAQELGIFAKYGLEVELSREFGWATIRDKVLYGELDAAHAVAGLVFAATLGIGCVARPCVTGLVLNLHGNAITLSNELRAQGVHDAATLRREIERTRGRRQMIFGVASLYSSHNFVLREWLRRAGIDPMSDVEIVTVPPPQMHDNLRAGNVDGYCVGEPWNSLAVLRRTGWCVATSAELAPRHPEKVLMTRASFAVERPAEHIALMAALLEACAFCDRPENRERVMEALAQPAYLDAPIHALRMSLNGTFDYGHGRVEKDRDFHIFSRDDANRPTAETGEWVLQQMAQSGLLDRLETLPEGLIARCFRTDFFLEAERLVKTTNPNTTTSK
jgi:ABC-type nitrate/sulfonate/bicarbonate transport system substrate-binding protein